MGKLIGIPGAYIQQTILSAFTVQSLLKHVALQHELRHYGTMWRDCSEPRPQAYPSPPNETR